MTTPKPLPDATTATGRLGGSRNDAHAYEGEVPVRRTKAGQGYPGKDDLNGADFRFRAVLAKLARDPDDDARCEGAQIAAEATEILRALTRRADRATSAHKRAEAAAAKLGAQLDRRLPSAPETGTPTVAPVVNTEGNVTR